MTRYIIVSTDEGYPITCPHCAFKFGIKQRKGGGTYYATKITQLTKIAILMLQWWVRGYPEAWMKTRDAFNLFRQHAVEHPEAYNVSDRNAILSCKMISFMARMSEMTGLKIFESTKGERRLVDEATQKIENVSVAKYKINKERAWQIIEAKGKIEKEMTLPVTS